MKFKDIKIRTYEHMKPRINIAVDERPPTEKYNWEKKELEDGGELYFGLHPSGLANIGANPGTGGAIIYDTGDDFGTLTGVWSSRAGVFNAETEWPDVVGIALHEGTIKHGGMSAHITATKLKRLLEQHAPEWRLETEYRHDGEKYYVAVNGE